MTMEGIHDYDSAKRAVVQAIQDRRKSSAAGTHQDRRTRRNRDRAAQHRRAVEDQQR